jgi:pimeloyl-ACP methyl ester carboxylesterase
MAQLQLNQVLLHYDLTGVRPAVVCVHGAFLDHHDWDVVAAQLAADSFQVLSYDRRGHSESSGTGSFDDDVADLAGLIEYLQLGRVHLVGNSLGGCLALRLAMAHPEVLRSVSVHEPPLLALLADDAETRPMVEMVQRCVQVVLDEFGAGQTEQGARRFVEEVAFGKGAWEKLPAQVRATIIGNAPTFVEENTDLSIYGIDLQALWRIDRPVLLTQGSQSPAFFGAILDRLQAVLPQVERRVLPGLGHVPQLTDPIPYAEELRTFITAVDRITDARGARGSQPIGAA